MTGGGLARSSRVRVVAAVVAVLFVTAGAMPLPMPPLRQN